MRNDDGYNDGDGLGDFDPAQLGMKTGVFGGARLLKFVSKRGKTGGGMNLRFTGGHELDLFWECCRPPTSMAYRMPI